MQPVYLRPANRETYATNPPGNAREVPLAVPMRNTGAAAPPLIPRRRYHQDDRQKKHSHAFNSAEPCCSARAQRSGTRAGRHATGKHRAGGGWRSCGRYGVLRHGRSHSLRQRSTVEWKIVVNAQVLDGRPGLDRRLRGQKRQISHPECPRIVTEVSTSTGGFGMGIQRRRSIHEISMIDRHGGSHNNKRNSPLYGKYNISEHPMPTPITVCTRGQSNRAAAGGIDSPTSHYAERYGEF